MTTTEGDPGTRAMTSDATNRLRPAFGTVVPQPAPVRERRSRLPLIIGACLLLTAIGATLWFYFVSGRQFPALASGSYIGTITGVFEGKQPVSFYLERAPESEELFAAVLAPGWKPQIRATALFVGSDTREMSSARWQLPLLLSKGDQQIELVGVAEADGTYRGTVRDVHSDKEGVWRLGPIRSPPGDVERTASSVRLWLMLTTELEEITARIAEMQRRLPQQRMEMDKLSVLLSEGQELRSRANEKFAEVRSELEGASQLLEKERKEVRRLESALDVSQKVTPSGRLVGLARESLEREARVVDSLLRSETGMTSADLEVEYRRAEEALALQAEVLRLKSERAAIDERSRRARYKPTRHGGRHR